MTVDKAIFLILLLLFAWEVHSTGCEGSISQDEFSALEIFFDATGGSQWHWNNKDPPSTLWSFPNTLNVPCSDNWQGITCAPVVGGGSPGCVVYYLELQEYNLTGTLPSALGNLTSLHSLYLYTNELVGTIPTELGMLTLLEGLALYYNHLSGSVPTEIGNMGILEYLELDFNSLTGVIPSEVGELSSQLSVFVVASNSLTGTLPTEIGLLTGLAELIFSSNRISGSIPSEVVGPLVDLNYLVFFENILTGTLPTEVGHLAKMQYLMGGANHISGTIPTEIGESRALLSIVMQYNHLSGTIPAELGDLAILSIVQFNDNNLTGTIPTELGQCVTITSLILSVNSLSGSIPTQMGALKLMVDLYLNENNFSGSLPGELFHAVSLAEIEASNNALTGTVPTEIALLPQLTMLDLQLNNFTGKIPTQIGAMAGIQTISFSSNCLTGSLPSELGQLSAMLSTLDLANNRINGTLPTELGLLGKLLNLILTNNSISGTVPTQLSQIPSLHSLYFNENRLTGGIPAELGLFSDLYYLDLDSNCLTGTIPSELIRLQNTGLISVYDNSLSGTIPPGLARIDSLGQLWLSNNMFTGSIDLVSSITELVTLNASYNFFSGTVPAVQSYTNSFDIAANFFFGEIGDAFLNCTENVRALDFSNNLLYGPVPMYFARFNRMRALNLSQNAFSGPIDFVVMAEVESILESIDLSGNTFSGTIPAFMFGPPLLSTVILLDNCFYGSIPSSVCNASKLHSLFLDSLTGNCGSALPAGLQDLLKGVFPKRLMSGSIPSCIWQMPALKIAHLSGNGLKGTLTDLTPESNLDVVIASGNRLSGTIPLTFQKAGQFSQLDLSENSFTGVLSDDFVVDASCTYLDLSLNRLSGQLPPKLEPSPDSSMTSFKVLDGNLFECQSDSLPINDPDHSSYTCGSSDFNVAAEFTVVSYVLILAVFVTGWKSNSAVWASTSLRNELQVLKELRQNSRWILKVVSSLSSLSLILFLCFKLAPGLSMFRTYSEQYLWSSTVAFLHGWAPVFVVSVLVLVAIIFCLVWERSMAAQDGRNEESAPSERQHICMTIKNGLIIGSVHFVNIFMVLVINGAYIIAILHGLSKNKLLVVQLCLGLFKLTWNAIVIPWFLTFVSFVDRKTSHRLFMTFFVFIGGPFFSTFFTSSDCFLEAVTGQSAVVTTASVTTYSCIDSCSFDCGDECTFLCRASCQFFSDETFQVEQTPVWLYSYQCSSSLLQDYIPVLLMSFAVSGAIVPFLGILCLFIGQQKRRKASSVHWIESLTNGALCIYESNEELLASQPKLKDNLYAKFLLNVGVLLTFGVASPLLGFAIGLETACRCLYFHLVMSRFTEPVNQFNESSRLLSVPVVAHTSDMTIVLLWTAIFWSLFCFDMIGDVYGSLAAGLSLLIPLGSAFAGCMYRHKEVWMGPIKESSGVIRKMSISLLGVGMELRTSSMAPSEHPSVNPQCTQDKFCSL
jgi:Leucine-rich repeat (LRR) protein